jgi:hypothetical protein
MLSIIDELLTYINVRSFHWILLTIEVDYGRVEIMDSSNKDPEEYRSLLDMLQR